LFVFVFVFVRNDRFSINTSVSISKPGNNISSRYKTRQLVCIQNNMYKDNKIQVYDNGYK